MHVYVKITAWQRIDLASSLTKEDVIRIIETNGTDALKEDEYCTNSENTDCESYISPEENGGEATVELYDEESNIIWKNSEK